ncbi:hypothetical protein DPMN_022275 [Dreissena polymorpha]|uniref:Uncharacterized protein n=1 Tax=Dreissena polymorpha TaxID=45954 RepID=A0A9D4NP64_DREPO|nr:hypothetical protein DPMN_022275 [Dreissena polymorpha]
MICSRTFCLADCHWQEGTDEVNERKRSKYQELADMCKERRYTTWIFPVEIGCRSYPAQSV